MGTSHRSAEVAVGMGSQEVIFVFGSNLAGRHGAGAALYAQRCRGAIYGQGEGLQGDSYAIPTKDHDIKTLPLVAIAAFVHKFIQFAWEHPELKFEVTPIGCGLAGYKPSQIAPFFRDAPENCILPEVFTRHIISSGETDWGQPVGKEQI